MSILDSIQLPPVIKLADVSASVKSGNPKPLIVLCSRDMSDEDLEKFEQQGKTLKWKDSLINVPFSSLEFDYLLIDLRSKNARITIQRQDLSRYNVVAYVWAIQKETDDFISQSGAIAISSIPEHAINKADFDQQLLTEKLKAPSVAKSFLRIVMSCLSK